MPRTQAEANRETQHRGSQWEGRLEQNCKAYDMANRARYQHEGQKVVHVKGGGLRRVKSPTDFSGYLLPSWRPFRFEAKHFTGTKWKFDEWEPNVKVKPCGRKGKRAIDISRSHQLAGLRVTAKDRGLAFVAVCCWTERNEHGIYVRPEWCVPLSLVEDAIAAGDWFLTIAALDRYAPRMRGGDWLAVTELWR